ncbi:phage tail domain-containing protein [Gracilibacillus dipsosauri]|uniref:phage tail domain-containing protein n=1 Tax=Gracilibacillus dipsosauri TaxID=178340 RepID=UPI0024096DEB
MIKLGITFDGRHSSDYDLRLVNRIIGNPNKIKTKERVPYSNEMYDFSAIYGGQEYEERTLTYTFNVKDYNKVDLELKKTAVINWVMQSNKKIMLVDDYIPGYYFMAEVEDGPDFSELRYNGRITINFTAYPFRISELEEGNDIWDTFNFLLDVAQITDFNVNGTINTTLYNAGVAALYPIIRSTAPMEIVKNGITYTVPIGESKSLDFYLSTGENPITINGNGNISFHFRKELI